MKVTRRQFVALAAATTANTIAISASAAPSLPGTSKISAVALDALTTFDLSTLAVLAERLFPGKGAELSTAWRNRQFEYAWLRTLTGQYADFWHVTEDALLYAAKSSQLDLTGDVRDQLMEAFLHLKAWPDALPALTSMKKSGLKIAFLSNFTTGMLDAAVRNSNLQGIFEPHLSTDRVRAYKPDPRAYQMAIDAFGKPRDHFVFAVFGGWDAAGAKAFGFPTFWVNRMNLPLEELGSAPDAIGATLHDLAGFVTQTGSTARP
jgi:2-haloacid dehalogenase